MFLFSNVTLLAKVMHTKDPLRQLGGLFLLLLWKGRNDIFLVGYWTTDLKSYQDQMSVN